MSNEQKQKLKDYRKEYYKKYYAEKKLNNKKIIHPSSIKIILSFFADFGQVKKILSFCWLWASQKILSFC